MASREKNTLRAQKDLGGTSSAATRIALALEVGYNPMKRPEHRNLRRADDGCGEERRAVDCDAYLAATLTKAAKRGTDGLKSRRALSGQQSVVVEASGGPGAVHRRGLGAM